MPPRGEEEPCAAWNRRSGVRKLAQGRARYNEALVDTGCGKKGGKISELDNLPQGAGEAGITVDLNSLARYA